MLERLERTAAELRIEPGVLERFAAQIGPIAVVDLETTGLSPADGAEILEFGILLIDADAERMTTLSSLVCPSTAIPRAVKRLTGIEDREAWAAPALDEVKGEVKEALAGRVIVAHNAGFERTFLAKYVDPGLENAKYLDTLDLLALTHPDAPDLRLESFTRAMLGTEENHRGLDDALDTARVMALAGHGSEQGEPRYVKARSALEAYASETLWLSLLEKPLHTGSSIALREPFAKVGASDESPVPFHEDAIAAALEDEERGRRHFPGYRVRAEQVELARHFARNLDREEVLLAEGGTGVGKSLAYLAAAIPFAMEADEAGELVPILISTRTKLLQDQLMDKDIAAAARFLGYPELRAISIKGRANYACARRLRTALSEGHEQSIFPEDRLAYAVLDACASTRPHGEIQGVPGALLRRYPPLRGLIRRSVASRSEHCTRDQCAKERACPLGRRRSAMTTAHLIVANHDLLLRWPPDYPSFQHAIVDEAHELADVADEVYAVSVRPDDVLDRLDEIFGRPAAPGRKRGDSLLPAGQRRALEKDSKAWRRDLLTDLAAVGRALQDKAGDFGEIHISDPGARELGAAARAAEMAAERIDHIVGEIPDGDEGEPALARATEDLRDSAHGLRLAFAEDEPDAVASFENVIAPFDRWRLIVRQVSPADSFHQGFMDGMRSFAAVSASLFVGGDSFAAFGDLGLLDRAGERLQTIAVPSPFDYPNHMRVVAMRGGQDLVAETSFVLEKISKALGGRTLGLFTSLRRMNEVADDLDPKLRFEGIDVITPRRGNDDPSALVTRFVNGAGVLLGARRFWQGIDIPGDALQAVVIEKLPFEVPTELRKRREARLKERGIDAFNRYGLGKMLLNLKQMSGRLIRTEEDRGIVILVEGRPDRRYFSRLNDALPEGSQVSVVRSTELLEVLLQVGITPIPEPPPES
jgi:ATP-dependent DNA helicase DinG